MPTKEFSHKVKEKKPNPFYRVIPPVNIIYDGFFKFYKFHKGKIETSKEVILIARTLCRVIAEFWIKKKAGVILPNFGYLCHWLTPSKITFQRAVVGGSYLQMNPASSGWWYNTTLFPYVDRDKYLKYWTLDRTASELVKYGVYKELARGMRYKLFFDVAMHSLCKITYRRYKTLNLKTGLCYAKSYFGI